MSLGSWVKRRSLFMGAAAGLVAARSALAKPFLGCKTTTAQSNFSVNGTTGQIIAPSGNQFQPFGIAIHDSDLPSFVANAQCQPLTTLFPKINLVRLMAESYWGASTYATQINWLTSQKIMVCIQNFQNFNANGSSAGNVGGGQGVIFTGALLATESAWFAACASYFASNPYVIFGTNNEPSTTDANGSGSDIYGLWQWQQSTYNAIRGTGSNALIEIEQPATYLQGAYALDFGAPSGNPIFGAMKNIFFGPHLYPYIFNADSVDPGQSAIYSSPVTGFANGAWGGVVQQMANLQTLTSQDGKVPCCIWEFGPSDDNLPGAAAGGYSMVAALVEACTNNVCAGLAFFGTDTATTLDLTSPSNLTGSLTTPWGTTAAAYIAANTRNGSGTLPYVPNPPPQASAVGLTNLVFNDDFTSNTFATSPTQNGGANWYYSFTGSPVQTAVNETQTAAQLAAILGISTTGGGSNASPLGGIASMLPVTNIVYDAWISVPGGYLNNSNAVQPPAGQGNWGPPFYIETYQLFNINTAPVSGSWPSFWSWSIEGLQYFGFGNSSLHGGYSIEIDFYESFGAANFGNAAGVLGSTIHYWPTSGPSNSQTMVLGYPQHSNIPAVLPYFDNNWHTIGCLCAPDPNNAGQYLISIYIDNVQYGSIVSTINGYPLAPFHQFLIMSAAGGSPTYVDWVRVWQL
jgi:hypothetical protein